MGRIKANKLRPKAEGQGATAWGNKQSYKVKFVHEPTGHTVEFPALIDNFKDTHSPELTNTYGGNEHDPYVSLARTTRNISFDLTVLSTSLDEARYNTQCVNLLIQMMYPTLNDDGTFKSKPYINIRLMNLLQGVRSNLGISCCVSSLSYGINFEEGVITGITQIDGRTIQREVYPISLKLSIQAKTLIPASRDINSPLPRNFPSYGGR